jgi:ankyrin repeat protein
LYQKVKEGNVNYLRRMLKDGLDPDQPINGEYLINLPLNVDNLYYTNGLNILKLLLQYNADPNIQDEFGQTPLMHLFKNFYHNDDVLLNVVHATANPPNYEEYYDRVIAGKFVKQRIRLLLEAGADIAIEDIYGKDAMYYADESELDYLLREELWRILS